MDAKITDNFDLSLGLSGYVSTDSEPGAGAGPGTYASIFQQAMLSYPYLRSEYNGLPVGSLNLDGNGNKTLLPLVTFLVRILIRKLISKEMSL